ncbi:MAG: 4Fe-4S dicluster domain-containing protein [bacterium]
MAQEDGVYRLLQQHLDKQAVGFPAARSGADIRFLQRMFTPDEAKVALHLSYRPTPLANVVAGTSAESPAGQTERLLNSMLMRGAIGWKDKNGTSSWYLLPMVIGMYEAQDGNPTREFLEDANAFMSTLGYGKAFMAVKPSQMRTVPVNKSIPVEHHIASYDQIKALILNARGPFVALKCICREAKSIKGKPCKQTSRMETCLGMNDVAVMVLRRKNGREVNLEEALAILQQNEDDGLVLQPANAQNPEFVCSCCGCCRGMLSFHKFIPRPVDFWASNFSAEVNADTCTNCGKCVKRCQVNAVALTGPTGKAVVNLKRCIGCGLCVPTCPANAIKLRQKPEETVPPQTEEELYDKIMENKKGRWGQTTVLVKAALGLKQ